MASKRNFTEKREAIYKTIASTKIHPTAEWIYNQLKPSIPNLSLGTVYRNIAMLREMGVVKSIGVIGGHEHFDANTSQHSHFICNKCFKIVDIPNSKNFFDRNLYLQIANQLNVSIEDTSIIFYGVCGECSGNIY